MDQGLRRKFDQITDILWAGGVTNPITYIEQISYLIYLKLLDEEESTRELQGRLGAGDGVRLFPAQAERFRWSKWRFKSGNECATSFATRSSRTWRRWSRTSRRWPITFATPCLRSSIQTC